MTSIITIQPTDYQDASRADLNTNFAALNAGKTEKSGDTMTGLLQFSGTGHAGLQVNSLTTTQRNALTPANGMMIYNSTLSAFESYQNGKWGTILTPNMTTTVRDTLTATNGMLIYNTTVNNPQMYVNSTWTNLVMAKWGGTGVDGALSVSAGTTTIDLGGAQFFIKNYTSISITGTGKIGFSNPHANGTNIIFRSSGDYTNTSSDAHAIDLRLMGAAGGGGYDANCGNGGRGAASFLAEIAGNFNFTGTVDGSGANGGDATATASTSGAGGGGAGSSVWFIYSGSLTANTGVITVAAGSVGSPDSSGGLGGTNNGSNGQAAYGSFGAYLGGTGAGASNSGTNPPNIISASIIAMRMIPMFPGPGGGGGGRNGSGSVNGSTPAGCGFGGSGVGFSAVIKNDYFV